MSEDKCFDNSKAKNDFGFNPIGFEKGLKLQINQMFKGGYLSQLSRQIKLISNF